MNLSFILMIISASALPLLAILALFLRRNLFKGKRKILFLLIGLGLLLIAVLDTFHEHHEELSSLDILVGGVTAIITITILSKFSHHHTHTGPGVSAKGIVISEAFHSLIDGAVIGATYLVNPVLGYAATLGIIVHELPKILGTITVLRGLGLSVRQTCIYGILAQAGSPVSAVLIYMLGSKVNDEQFHTLEIASISSLGAIVLFILYLEIRFHQKHDHPHSKSDHNKDRH